METLELERPAVKNSNGSCIKYLVHDPGDTQRKGTLIAVHGISRQYTEQYDRMLGVAQRLNLRLVAPCFTQEGFPDYQRLGRAGRGARSDRALIDLIDVLEIDAAEPLFIQGFSGGAQFAHRLVFAYPERFQGAIIISAGFYTMLDAYAKFPYGIRLGQRLPGIRMQPEAILRVPTLTIVGAQDTQRDKNLRQSTSLDARQGLNRRQRAESWHQDLVKQSNSVLEGKCTHQFLEVEGVGHDFMGVMNGGESYITSFIQNCLKQYYEKSQNCE